MKIGKHLPLFFLSILFALVLPHFHDQAHADPTMTEFSVPTLSSDPQGIIPGPDGNLWFTEVLGNKVGRITPSGTITEFSIPTSSSNPLGITSGPDGNLWFIEDIGKIGRITTSGTITEYSVPTSNSDLIGITSGPDGNLWFTERYGNKIGSITTSGTITEYSVPTSTSDPQYITSGPDGNLWFTEWSGNKIGSITTSGTITEYSVPTGSSSPAGITSGPDGNLWFTEDIGKIGRITTSGTITEYSVPTSNSALYDITSGPDGNMWFVEFGGNKIGSITTSGTITEYSVPTSSSGLQGITSGPDGNVWFAERSSNKIGRVNLSGLSARPPLIFIPGIEGSNFTVDQTFDPGFGSCPSSGLTYSYNQGDTVWFDLNRLLTYYVPCNSKYLDVLKLQSDGQTAVYPHVVVKNGSLVDAQGLNNTNIGYHDTLQYLEGRYTLNTNLFIFAYDWRKDLAGNMTALDNMINQATTSAGTTQANIMAHSQGGLIARKYISDATRAQKVNTLVELGTPHAGSLDALVHLLYPACIKSFGLCFLDGNEVNTLVQNFTANFELLPSRLYYTLYPNLYPYKDTMFYGNMLGPLSYDSLHTLLDSYFHKNMTLFNTADSFHSNLDSTYSTSNGVKIYLIAGSGLKTFGQLFDYVSPIFGEIKTDAITTNGDSVVPLLSATLNNTSNVFYVKKNHGDLVASGSALYMAYNLLNGQTGLISGIQTTPFQGGDGQIVGVFSPTQLDAYDNSNNHTGKKSDGTYEQNIPGSEYYELGDSKFIYLPSGGSYNITTKATAAGHFDLKVKNYTNDQITQQTLFFGVSQTASTTASMNLATTSAVLSVDVNGNGTNIQQVSPNYTLTGSSATDSAAPITTAALSPNPNGDGTYSNPVTVTLSATASAGFSVTNTYYTVDGGTQQTYASPFTVSGAASHTITYWSVDSASVSEFHNTKTFTIVTHGISLRAVASGNNGSGGTSLVINKPTGTLSGDVMVAHVNVRTGGNTITAPSGWNLIQRQDSGSSISTATYWKLAGSSEPSSYTWTFGTSGEASGGIASYTGVNPTSPIDASNAQYNSSTSTVSNAGVTTSYANDMLVFAVGITVPTTVNVPTGFHEEWSVTSSSSTTSEMSDMLDATAGATGTISGSHNGGANSNITHLIALKPANGITSSHITNGTDSDGNASATTSSVTPVANKLYMMLVENATSISTNPQIPSVSGDNLTWVQVNTVVFDPTGTSRRRLTLFRAMGTSPTAGSLTITFNGENQALATWSLDEFSNVDISGTNGSGAVVQSANNYVNTGASLVVSLSTFSNSLNASYGGFANWGGDPLNTGSGFTQVGKDTTNDTVLTEFKPSNDTTVDADGGGVSQQIGGIAVEIKAVGTTPVSITHLSDGSDNDGNASAATASVNLTANKLYLLTVESSTYISTDPVAPSVSGDNLTWVQVNSEVFDPTGTSRRRLTLFRAMGTNPSTGALSISFGSQNQVQVTWSLEELSGTDTSGTNGSGAVVQSANGFVNTGTSLTVTLASFASTSNATFGTFANWGGDPLNIGSGFTQVAKNTTLDTVLSEFKSTNDTTVDADGGGVSQQIGGVAVEIKAGQ